MLCFCKIFIFFSDPRFHQKELLFRYPSPLSLGGFQNEVVDNGQYHSKEVEFFAFGFKIFLFEISILKQKWVRRVVHQEFKILVEVVLYREDIVLEFLTQNWVLLHHMVALLPHLTILLLGHLFLPLNVLSHLWVQCKLLYYL